MVDKKIKLSEIIESLEFTNDMVEYYYDPLKKETFMSNIGDIIEITEEELDELFDRSTGLQTIDEISEYWLMNYFTHNIKSDHIYELLQLALNGKGAFGRFYDVCDKYNLLDSWYEYRDKKYKEIALEWCEENHIEYVNDLKTK